MSNDLQIASPPALLPSALLPSALLPSALLPSGLPPPHVPSSRYDDALRLLIADSRSEQTRRAYTADLRDFFRTTGMTREGQNVDGLAVAALCSLTAGGLALVLNDYKAQLLARNLAEATINRRLAAVRSLLRMARRLGADVPDPSGLVTSEKVTTYRDTRGPAVADVIRLLSAPDRQTLIGKRDYALLVLLAENALRRAEICALDAGDFEAKERRLHITGKGKGTQKEWITLTATAIEALSDYLGARGLTAGERTAGGVPIGNAPLFINAARRSHGEGGRLTVDGLYHVLQTHGQRTLGRPLHPHSLRHAAITAALVPLQGRIIRLRNGPFTQHF